MIKLTRAQRAELMECVARALYEADTGIAPEDYERVMGSPRRVWSTGAARDTQPAIELCEHERDDYRAMARAAVAEVRRYIERLE